MRYVIQSVVLASFLVFFSSLSLAGQLVNINEASAVTIAENLSGIGEAKARAIVAYRNSNGRFTSVEDLTKVKGIGPKLLEKNRTLISLSKGIKKPAIKPADSSS